MTTNNIIRFIYEALEQTGLLKGRHKDTDWVGVNKVVKVIDNSLEMIRGDRDQFLQLVPVTIKNEGNLSDPTNMRKIYKYIVINEDSESIIKADIICSFCGTMDDPMAEYDMNLMLSKI